MNLRQTIKKIIKEISIYEINNQKDDYFLKKEKHLKKIESFQKLVNNSIENLKNTCDSDNDEDNEYVSYYACDFIDTLSSVRVTDVKKYDNHFALLIIIKYKNYTHMDETPFTNELRDEIRKYIPNITIEVEDIENNFPEHLRQW